MWFGDAVASFIVFSATLILLAWAFSRACLVIAH